MAKKRPEDSVGLKFGRLTILSVSNLEHNGGRKRKHFECVCECGNKCSPLCFSVLSGSASSCGCYFQEVSKVSRCLKDYDEGEEMFTSRPIYTVWQNMKARCSRKSHPSYKDYGARGIDFPEHWASFLGFYEDMSEGYEQGLELDRIDNDKGYSKENCRWTSHKINTWNTRSNTGSSSKYKGVHYDKRSNKWCADIKHNDIRYRLGCFNIELEAARAYDAKCIELRGEYAYTNQQQFPEDFI